MTKINVLAHDQGRPFTPLRAQPEGFDRLLRQFTRKTRSQLLRDLARHNVSCHAPAVFSGKKF